MECKLHAGRALSPSYSLMLPVLVLYCWVTNIQQIQWLKKSANLLARSSLQVRSLACFSWVPCLGSHRAAIKVLANLGSYLETVGMTPLLDSRIQFIAVLELRSPCFTSCQPESLLWAPKGPKGILPYMVFQPSMAHCVLRMLQIPLTSSSPPTSTFKRKCNYLGSTWIIQNKVNWP